MRVRLRQDRLHELLAGSRLSQNAWAMRVGVSRGHWSDLVNGRHPHPSAKTRGQMIEAFGVAVDDLFEIESASAAPDGAQTQGALPGRYVIDRAICEGSMGTVYLARDIDLGRAVAVKIVSEEAIAELGPERFVREIRRTAKLQHPHILPLHEAGVADGRPYYVMPFIAPGSLRGRLQQDGPLAPREALRLLRGIAAALDHAHAHGVLHCDVKPENVLVDGDHAYLADFGLSRAVHLEAIREWERAPEFDTAAGTAGYVSPEQARAGVDLDRRADVYSLACVFFEMLAGEPPFHGGTTTEVVRRRFDSLPPDVTRLCRDLPAAIGAVLARAMALDRDQRPASAGDFVSQLDLAIRVTQPAQQPDGLTRTLLPALARRVLPQGRPRLRGNLMNNLVDDLRFSYRSLRRRPLFACMAVLTLAIGIGANAAMFSVVHAVVLSPLPYEEPERLLRIFSTFEGSLCCVLSPPNFVDIRGTEQFDDLVAFSPAAFAVTGSDEPVRVSGYRVTHGFFELFGARPQVGRFFAAEDDIAGAPETVVLSDRLWRDRYDADPEIVGSTLIVDATPRTVIGVAPADFRVTGRPLLFAPHAWDPANMPGRGANSLMVFGRVASGATAESAMAELSANYAALVEAYPDAITNRGVGALPLTQWLVGDRTRQPLMVLWGAVGMVLLVACVNVINLVLARGETRQRELAIRAALGAGRGRLIGHFLTESLTLSVVGALVGLAGAALALRFLLATYGFAVPRSDEVGLSPAVLGFTIAIALGTGLIVGAIPALRMSGRRLQGVLQEASRGNSSGGSHRLRQTLVVVEVSAALILVIGAGLMLRSFWDLMRIDVGLPANELLAARVQLPQARYPDPADVLAFYNEFESSVRAIPGVRDAGLVSLQPFSGNNTNFSRILPLSNPEITSSFVESRSVSLTAFSTMGLGITAGRLFDDSLTPDDDLMVVINTELARQLFGEDDPLGQVIAPRVDGTPFTVIGVVETYREDGPTRSARPTIYFSHFQGAPSTMSILVRTEGDPLALVGPVREAVRRIDPELPVYAVERLSDALYDRLGSRRFQMSLLSTFGAIALALGAIGIYGVMAYSVERRTREIGLRQAIGASPGSVLGLVVGQGMLLTAVGIVLGAAGAYLLRQSLGTFVFELQAFDAATYGAVIALLAAVAAVACVIPARRAAAIDPMTALREE